MTQVKIFKGVGKMFADLDPSKFRPGSRVSNSRRRELLDAANQALYEMKAEGDEESRGFQDEDNARDPYWDEPKIDEVQ